MDEKVVNIKKNDGILLARNTPVALVVGAASFLGSHLVDKLLSKGIQVIGVDDLNFGKRENLEEAAGNKNFHLIISPLENLDLELEHLDYIFVIAYHKQNPRKVFDLFENLKSRLLLVSSIELYDKDAPNENLKKLRGIELEVAEIAKENNLNARILRLGPVFGPRMSFDSDFRQSDPIIRLIQQSLTGDLQKDTSLEFSSRALYIMDACDLIIKCIMGGATAQKIFDGVLPTPIKVSEIKQVLLDPIWYENKNFTPSELPPWPTPNLEKTIKFLNWYPRSKLIENLKLTLNYFKDNDIKVPKLEASELKEDKKEEDWKKEKMGELASFKNEGKREQKIKPPKFSFPKKKFLPFLIVFLIIYALVWPILQIGWGFLTFKSQLQGAISSLGKGEFDKSLSQVRAARTGIIEAQNVFYSLEPFRELGLLKSQFDGGDQLINLANLSADSTENTILGVQSLYQSLKSITGELNQPAKDYFDSARVYLATADEDLAKAEALIKSADFKSRLPKILKPKVDSLSDHLTMYANLVKKGRALSVLMPEAVALDGKKDYLILLQNNNELRPTGGFIGSFAKVSFEGGKLKNLQTNDTYAIDGQLNIHVEPPKDIKNDLKQNDYYLRDSNWEPDFPTSARQAEWFYNKETGTRVEGVVALDISAIEDLLSVVGSLDLPDYSETITSANLFERSISHAEVNFFPGTQAKKSFLTALTTSLFNKLFFLPNQNWPGIVTSLGRSLEHKHMSIYLDNPKLFSYIISQNWGGVLPRANTNDELVTDFLAPVEANLGANKVNYYLDRSYNLETIIGKNGEVSHRLRIAYTNRSPADAFPGGEYKNRMRAYLPFGTKLNRALWGEKDITKDVSSFTDYGRAGYSFLIDLPAKQQKTLVLDYQTSLKLEFKDKIASYRLDVVKQAGTIKDPFIWTVTYPLNVKVVSSQTQNIAPQQYSIQTDLSTDKTFQLQFSRP